MNETVDISIRERQTSEEDIETLIESKLFTNAGLTRWKDLADPFSVTEEMSLSDQLSIRKY